jgi:hypothetical protein
MQKSKQSIREWMAFLTCDNRCNWNEHNRCTYNKDNTPCPANLAFANSILSHIREEIEKVENPFTDKPNPPVIIFDSTLEHSRQFDRDCIVARSGFNSAKQAILKLLDEGK